MAHLKVNKQTNYKQNKYTSYKSLF